MSQIGNASVPNPLGIATPEPRLADFRADDNTSLVSMVVIRGVVRTLDVFIAATVGLAVALFYLNDPELFANPYYMAAIPFTAMVVALGFDMLGLYTRAAFSSFLRQMPRVILIWTIAFALMLAAAFFLKAGHELSRVWLATWYASGLVLLLAERATVTACVRHWIREGRLFRRAAIYGGSDISEKLISDLEKDVDSDIRIIGVFDDRGNKRIGTETAGYPHLGSLKNLVSYARHSRLDMIIVALPITAEKRVVEITHSLAVLPAEVKLPAGSSALRFTPKTYSHVGNVAMIDLLEKPIADWGAVSKWLFDKIVATLALIALSPVILAVAIAIKLDSRGPVLFRQKRYGFNNELI